MTENLHFATIWESISDALPESVAVIDSKKSVSYATLDERAARVAGALQAAGLQPDSKVGILLYNCTEYVEVIYASYKCRAIPINVNYRYLGAELLEVLDNADVEALFFHNVLSDRIVEIKDKLTKVRLFVSIEDGAPLHFDEASPYQDLVLFSQPMKRIERSGSDIHMLYTGGTTGTPKGVMTHISDYVRATLNQPSLTAPRDVVTLDEITDGTVVANKAGDSPVWMVGAPLMHGTGLYAAFTTLNLGGTILLDSSRHFDAVRVWKAMESHNVTHITIVGDAFAKPMLSALEKAAAEGSPFDLSTLKIVHSSGVMFSHEVKAGLLEYADITIIDAWGASEGGVGVNIANRQVPPDKTAQFRVSDSVKVLKEDGTPVEPGSDEIGLVATNIVVPIGYYKDPEKSAQTFKTIDGVRYSFLGDYASVDADGVITLLGRGSNCINTGGEKVFPEEVEEEIKRIPRVLDCLVVGLPDEKFGQRIAAVVSFVDQSKVPSDTLIHQLQTKIAGYKVPRTICAVDKVARGPNGKPDYAWAREVAAGA